MSPAPVICFGQQPCGFFPKRFLAAKFQTARRLQSEIGGEIIFFYHDSDHDPRETRTILRHRTTNEPAPLNFAFANKLQRKFSPLYLKRIVPGWQAKTELQLPNYVDRRCLEVFKATSAENIADFCLEMYRHMGLLSGIRVVRSSDPAVRNAACEVPEFYVDVPYQGEVVRARYCPGAPTSISAQDKGAGTSSSPCFADVSGDEAVPAPESRPFQSALAHGETAEVATRTTGSGTFTLHEGGDSFITLPPAVFAKHQISPTRDSRLRWMQSVVHCTHYVAGVGEKDYLRQEEAPEITFVSRDAIDRSDEAYTEIPG